MGKVAFSVNNVSVEYGNPYCGKDNTAYVFAANLQMATEEKQPQLQQQQTRKVSGNNCILFAGLDVTKYDLLFDGASRGNPGPAGCGAVSDA